MAGHASTSPVNPILNLVNTLSNNYENKCRVGRWFGDLSEEEQQALGDLLRKPRVNRTEVYEKLSQIIELPFKITLFKSHVKGSCSCPKQ